MKKKYLMFLLVCLIGAFGTTSAASEETELIQEESEEVSLTDDNEEGQKDLK